MGVAQKRMIESSHIADLLSDETLHKSANLSLPERVQQFNADHQLNEKLTVYKLRKLYKTKLIRKKQIHYKPCNPKKYNKKYYTKGLIAM